MFRAVTEMWCQEGTGSSPFDEIMIIHGVDVVLEY